MSKAKPVLTTPTPSLREPSAPVAKINQETLTIISKMVAASLAWEKSHPFELSAAMAAPQLGFNQRIIIVRENMSEKEQNHFVALINPVVLKSYGKIKRDFEGCLSVPKIYGKVPRATKIQLEATLEDGKKVHLHAEGFLARTLLHEIDHLDGILFIDRIKNDQNAFYVLNEHGDLVPIDYKTHIMHNKLLFPDAK